MNEQQEQNFEQDIEAFSTLLLQIVSDLEKRLSSHMVRHGLTPPQFYVLRNLVEQGERQRIGALATTQHLTNATMTGIINRLESMSPPLVMRQPNADDGRSVDVILTDAGRQRYWDVQNGLLDQVRLLLHMLDPQERRDVVERVAAYFQMLTRAFPISAPPAFDRD